MTTKKKITHKKNIKSDSISKTDKNPINLKKISFLFSPIILLLAVIIYYWPILTANGFFWNDFPEQNFPYRLFSAVWLKKGIFPFWNPYVFSGMPYFADVQSAVLYPFNLLLTPFASNNWLSPLLVEYQIIFHIFLAGFFMYLLCKDMGCNKYGAILSGITFMFSSFFTTHIFHVNLIHSATWFPLLIMFFIRMLNTKKIKYAILSSFVLAIMFFAGYPQLSLHTYYWLGAFFLFDTITKFKSQKITKKESAVRAGLFLTVVILSIGMSSIQLLPTSKLGNESKRPELKFTESCEGSLRPYRLITIVVPKFFGNPNNAYWGFNLKDERKGPHYYWETAIYAGIISLILAGFAILLSPNTLTWFFVGSSGISLLLAMGNSFFLYKIIFYFLPGFNKFRVPGRFSFIFAFSVAILAGTALSKLTNKKLKIKIPQKIIKILLGVTISVILIALLVSMGALKETVSNFMLASGTFGSNINAINQYIAKTIYPNIVNSVWVFTILFSVSSLIIILRIKNKLSPKLFGTMSILILISDMLVIGNGYANKGSDPKLIYSKNNAVLFFQKQGEKEFFRINSRDSKPGTTDLGGRHMIFQKNQGSIHNLFLMEGYNPLRLKRQITDRRPQSLNILNVKYFIQVSPQTGQMGFIENPNYYPRARMVYNYTVEPEESKILPLLWSNNFNTKSTVILEKIPSVKPINNIPDSSWNVSITNYTLNKIDLKVTTKYSGLLILSEIYYPYWKAKIDGNKTNVYRCDYALRAIEVPAGTHNITCYYESDVFKKGLIISLLSFFTAILILFVPKLINRKKEL